MGTMSKKKQKSDLNLPLDTITWVIPIAMAENGKAANNKRADMFISIFSSEAKTKHLETIPCKVNKMK